MNRLRALLDVWRDAAHGFRDAAGPLERSDNPDHQSCAARLHARAGILETCARQLEDELEHVTVLEAVET